MNHQSIEPYLRPYGKIRTLRGSVMRSTFQRVVAAYDDYDETRVLTTLRAHGQDPAALHCVYCGAPASCWDHLVPAARGGTHQLHNLAPSCAPCNAEKGAKTWEDFLTRRGLDASAAPWQALARYTQGYRPGDTLVSPAQQARLDELLGSIHRLMDEADAIVEAAIAERHRPPSKPPAPH